MKVFTHPLTPPPLHPMGPESNPASTFLFLVYTKYKREKSTLNDFMEMVSKIQNRANSTELNPVYPTNMLEERIKKASEAKG